MARIFRTILVSMSVLWFSQGPVSADNTCRDDLINARIGMIEMDAVVRADPVSSREAVTLIDQGGGLNFQRFVDEFWRIKVEKPTTPSDLEVRYRLAGGDDRTGRAVHRDGSSQNFPVRLIPSQPRVLCENFSHRIISGGFTALARASGIGLAGLYALEIDVDVQER